MQAGVDIAVEVGHELTDRGWSPGQGQQDLVHAFATMLDVGVDERGDLQDRRAVGGPKGLEFARTNTLQTVQIVGHVAVRRGDHRG